MNLKNKKLLFVYSSLLILFFLFFPFPKFRNNFLWEAISDSLHIPVFFIVYLLIFYTDTKIFKIVANKKINILLVTIAISIIIELIQPIFERSFSLKDIISNSLGVLLAYLFLRCFEPSSDSKIKEYCLFTMTLVSGLLFTGIPIREAFLVFEERVTNFPTLYDPDNRLKLIASGKYGAKIKYSQNFFTQVVPSRMDWSGVEIELGESNWVASNLVNEQGLKNTFLEINLKNLTNSIIVLAIRIDDDQDTSSFESRFNQKIYLLSQEDKIVRIPLEDILNYVKIRKFNLESITRILIFSVPNEPIGTFGIGKIRLN